MEKRKRLNEIQKWLEDCQILFNIEKCKTCMRGIMHITTTKSTLFCSRLMKKMTESEPTDH